MSDETQPSQIFNMIFEDEEGNVFTIKAPNAKAAEKVFNRFMSICHDADQATGLAEIAEIAEIVEGDEIPEVAQPITAITETAEPIDDCPICYEPIGLINSSITECRHKFHTSCLIRASIFRRNCPYCRLPLFEEPESQHLSRTNGINHTHDQPPVVVNGWHDIAQAIQQTNHQEQHELFNFQFNR